MKRSILAFAVVPLTAGIYLLVETSRDAPRAGSHHAETHAVASPRVAPPTVAPRELPRLVVAVDSSRPAVEAESGEDQRPSGSPPLTGEEMRAQLEAAFAGDALVGASQDRAPGIAQRVSAVMPARSSVRSIECRASLCRIETVHASVAEFQELADGGYLTLDFARRVSNGPVLVALQKPTAEGQPVVGVAFLGRDGATLPAFHAAAPSGHR